MLDRKIILEMIKRKECVICGGRIAIESVYDNHQRDDSAARILCYCGHSWEFEWKDLEDKLGNKNAYN